MQIWWYYYTIHDLRKAHQTRSKLIFIFCYILQRYRQLKDNLMDAFCFHLKTIWNWS